jgi:hypothetical protein
MAPVWAQEMVGPKSQRVYVMQEMRTVRMAQLVQVRFVSMSSHYPHSDYSKDYYQSGLQEWEHLFRQSSASAASREE